MLDARREIIFVAVPIEAGSPEVGRRSPPPAYPRQGREVWRPAQAIPNRSKAGATLDLLRRIGEQERDLRAFMQEARRG